MSISVDQLEAKMGKAKCAEFITHSQKGETKAQKLKRARWGKGRTCMAFCKHGKMTVKDYKPTGNCEACQPGEKTSHGFRPYFNIGLGHFVESRADEKATAKRMGLVEAG